MGHCPEILVSIVGLRHHLRLPVWAETIKLLPTHASLAHISLNITLRPLYPTIWSIGSENKAFRTGPSSWTSDGTDGWSSLEKHLTPLTRNITLPALRSITLRSRQSLSLVPKRREALAAHFGPLRQKIEMSGLHFFVSGYDSPAVTIS